MRRCCIRKNKSVLYRMKYSYQNFYNCSKMDLWTSSVLWDNMICREFQESLDCNKVSWDCSPRIVCVRLEIHCERVIDIDSSVFSSLRRVPWCDIIMKQTTVIGIYFFHESNVRYRNTCYRRTTYMFPRYNCYAVTCRIVIKNIIDDSACRSINFCRRLTAREKDRVCFRVYRVTWIFLGITSTIIPLIRLVVVLFKKEDSFKIPFIHIVTIYIINVHG